MADKNLSTYESNMHAPHLSDPSEKMDIYVCVCVCAEAWMVFVMAKVHREASWMGFVGRGALWRSGYVST